MYLLVTSELYALISCYDGCNYIWYYLTSHPFCIDWSHWTIGPPNGSLTALNSSRTCGPTSGRALALPPVGLSQSSKWLSNSGPTSGGPHPFCIDWSHWTIGPPNGSLTGGPTSGGPLIPFVLTGHTEPLFLKMALSQLKMALSQL